MILCIFLGKISGKNSSLKNATTLTKENIFFLKIRDRLTLNAYMGTKHLKNATINHPVKLRIYRVNPSDRISNSDRFLQKKLYGLNNVVLFNFDKYWSK